MGWMRTRAGIRLATLAVVIMGSNGTLAAGPSSGGGPPQGSAMPGPAFVYGRWGFVVARHPSRVSYTPSAIDRGNSKGGINTVTRTAVGRYRVTFPLLGTAGGTALVTPIASSLRLCTVESWFAVGTDELVRIRCFRGNGVLADSRFSVNFLRPDGSAKVAYVWADQMFSSAYTPDPAYQFNSTGGINTITSTGIGRYTVVLPGFSYGRGDVQVSTYGSAAASCRVGSWGPTGTDMEVGVGIECRGSTGGYYVARQFTMTYTRNVTLKGTNAGRAAYLLADRWRAGSYLPQASYRYTSWGVPPRVTRSARGRYLVHLNGISGRGGSAQVTAYGVPEFETTRKSRCVIGSISTTGTPQLIGVRCFSPSGAAVDSQFTLSYTR